MKHLILLSLATLAMSLGACHKNDNASTFRLDTPFTLDYNATSVLEDNPAVQIRFDKVLEDSRCPLDALCVWAGRVVVEVTVTQASGSKTGQLALGDYSGTAYSDKATFGGYTVQLKEVLPAPMSSQTVTDKDYSLKLEVKKTQ